MHTDMIRRFNSRVSVAAYHGSWGRQYSDAACQMYLTHLSQTADVLWDHRTDSKITFSGDWGYVYTNDIALTQALAVLPFVRYYGLTEAVVSKPRDTVVLKDSKFTHRSYFSERAYTKDEKERLLQFFNNQPEIFVSKPAIKWLMDIKGWRWSRNYFYVDHNSQLIITMIGLVLPGIIRKTLPIILKDK